LEIPARDFANEQQSVKKVKMSLNRKGNIKTWLVVRIGCPSIRLSRYLNTVNPDKPFSAQY
jgi:hypothetical protein